LIRRWAFGVFFIRPPPTSDLTGARFRSIRSSTKDKIKGTVKEVKGTVKERAGGATGNRDMQDRGTAEKTGGKIQRKVGDIKKSFGK
jgi:uncharacterized protein YjbJ (UPF0337 family)